MPFESVFVPFVVRFPISCAKPLGRVSCGYSKIEMMRYRASVTTISSVIIVNAFLYLLYRDQTFVHIDAIAHINKAHDFLLLHDQPVFQLGLYISTSILRRENSHKEAQNSQNIL